MKQTVVAIVGCGRIADAAHFPALTKLDYVKIKYACDLIPEKAQKLVEKHGVEGAQIITDYKIALADPEVDIVLIITPPATHYGLTMQALKAGKNVFVEKPVCFNDDEMDLLLKTEKETGAKVQVGQVVRLFNEYAWLKKVVDSGEYGKVVHGEFRRLSSRPTWAWDNWLHQPEKSGGVAVDMHVHDVDFVRYILGEPDTVKAHAYRDADGVIQQINTVYGYGKDVSIALEAGWNYPADFPFTADYRVMFEKATVTLSGGVLTVYPVEGGSFNPEMAAEFEGTNDIGGNVSSLGGYYNELKYFVEGLQGKNDLSVAPISDAIESVKLSKREIEAAGGLIVK